MTCLNEVLSITALECDSLINEVSFPREPHYFETREPGRGSQVEEERAGLVLLLSCAVSTLKNGTRERLYVSDTDFIQKPNYK